MSAHNSGAKRKPILLTPEPSPERTEVDVLKDQRRVAELRRLDEEIAKQPAEQRTVFQRLRSLIT